MAAPSSVLYHAATPLLSASLAHPLVVGLGDGTLPLRCFQIYVVNDDEFLRAFAEAYRLCLSRFKPRAGTSEETVQQVRGTLERLIAAAQAELSQHGARLHRWSLDPTVTQTYLSATTAYTGFLLRVASRGSVSQSLAAMVPCMRLYAHIGHMLHTCRSAVKAMLGESSDPFVGDAYSEWVAEYAGESFQQHAIALEALLDLTLATEATQVEAAADAKEAVEQYLLPYYAEACRLEWHFWQDAWVAGHAALSAHSATPTATASASAGTTATAGVYSTLLSPLAAVALDWDDTLTAVDTTDRFGKLAVRAAYGVGGGEAAATAKDRDWKALVQQYVDGFAATWSKACADHSVTISAAVRGMSPVLPCSPPRIDVARSFITSLDAFELHMARVVSDSRVLEGIALADAYSAARDGLPEPHPLPPTPLRPYARLAVQQLATSLPPSASLAVVSVNWSSKCILAALGDVARSLSAGQRAPITVRCNDLQTQSDHSDRSSGVITGGIHCAADKVEQLKQLCDVAGTGRLCVYVGDSHNDLAALLAADVGIIFPRRGRSDTADARKWRPDSEGARDAGTSQQPSKLLTLCVSFGIAVLPLSCLLFAPVRSAVAKQRLAHAGPGPAGPLLLNGRPVLFEAEGFDEITAVLCGSFAALQLGLAALPAETATTAAAVVALSTENVSVDAAATTEALALLPASVQHNINEILLLPAPAALPAAPASPSRALPRVLIVAGSDSGGGAGIQADLKATSALGVFATTAVTALTAQNTHGVQAVHVAPAAFLTAQLNSVLTDIGCDVVKTGMLPDEPSIDSLLSSLAVYSQPASVTVTVQTPLLIADPVMISSSGHPLLDPSALAAVRAKLLPRALLMTPNIPEAAFLLGGRSIMSVNDMKAAAMDLARTCGTPFVLLKGGHLLGTSSGGSTTVKPRHELEGDTADVTDVLYAAGSGTFFTWSSPRLRTRTSHGTGCTLASAIAAALARGLVPVEHSGVAITPLAFKDTASLQALVVRAVTAGRTYVQATLRASAHLQPIGHGAHGPMHHAWAVDASQQAPADIPRTSFDVSLYAVTDPHFNAKHGRSLAEVAAAAIAGGATLLQLREKETDTAAFIAAGKTIMAVARAHNARLPPGATPVRVVINDRVDVALAVDADGVHVGQSDMDAATARRLIGPHRILGVTVATVEEALAAEAAGADNLGTNAIFATSTKSDSAPIGLTTLADICSVVRIPVVAIGGIGLHNAADVLRCWAGSDAAAAPASAGGSSRCGGTRRGPAGVAVVSALFDQPDVQAATERLKTVVQAAMLR